MSTSTKPIHLKEIYFKNPTLTPIRINRTYKKPQNLYQEAKANAQSVLIELSGGANSHFCIIISSTAYPTISSNDP